jgi:hypothetical protein
MKSPLLSTGLAIAIFLFSAISRLSAQTVIFSEDFSGFTTGTHSSPNTHDASGNLDTKTEVTGWTGYKVYSAAGEIKLGTSNVPGWIETPEINLSGYDVDLFVKFDISRWPDDATSVRVLLNGSQIGNTLTPVNEFQTVEIPITDGISSGKIKFESLEKRFYLDNIQVIAQNPTGSWDTEINFTNVKVYPNPTGNIITVDNVSAFNRCEIYNINGKIIIIKNINGSASIIMDLQDVTAGIYFIRLSSSCGIIMKTIIKY